MCPQFFLSNNNMFLPFSVLKNSFFFAKIEIKISFKELALDNNSGYQGGN